jgi:hypothetical protein
MVNIPSTVGFPQASWPHAVPASKAESFIVIGFRLKLHPRFHPRQSAFIRGKLCIGFVLFQIT